MNREILFRGKRLDNGEWIEGDGIHYPKSINYLGTCWIDGMENRANDWIQVDPGTVGQFTGLCDKNGVKIFEGDVIRIKIEGESPFTFNYLRKVVFVNGIFGIGKQKDEESIRPFPIYSMDMFKIIGNIHDNPELAKEESQNES